jgi:hypothetical protein
MKNGEEDGGRLCREAKEQMEEDVKMLRQVLDNLLAFLYRRNMRWYNSRSQKRFSGFQ